MIFRILQDQNKLEWLGIKPQTDVEAEQLDRIFRMHEIGLLDAVVRPNPEDGSIALPLRPPGPTWTPDQPLADKEPT